MSHHTLEELAAIVAEWARGVPELARVYLYGSRVRGRTKDGHPVAADTDLDVALEVKREIDADPNERLFAIPEQAIADLAARLPVPLHDQLLEREAPHSIASYVAECSILVYEAANTSSD